MRKQLDSRIPTLIRNNVITNHRSFFVLVGDHSRDQIVNLHFLLSQSRVSSRPNVLWCYKKDLGFTTHRKKREAKLKSDLKKGVKNKESIANDPFDLFIGVTDIRYCYYKETNKILGQTFGMLVLQDFEAITPNLLARTIETVEGGGIVVLLLKTMTSLQQLYSVGMDAHSKYRSSTTDDDPVARFNERFLLSLGSSPTCLLLDDELNVLPLSKGKDITPIEENRKGKGKSRTSAEEELQVLREEVKNTKVVSQLIREAKTRDQALAVLSILDVLSASSTSSELSTTVALTAGRGRGKSAALGLAIAAAIAYGYSNIFVTSPSPENLKTLFQFLLKGLDALSYQEVQDWDLVRGAPGTDLQNTILRVNIFRNTSGSGSGGVGQGRQMVQYISPEDSHILGSNAELVVIDEAAAIPLPTVRELMGQGQYLVFLSSTINGYEGTGRSLSLKLLQQLRSAGAGAGAAGSGYAATIPAAGVEGGIAGLGLDQESGTVVKKKNAPSVASKAASAAAPGSTNVTLHNRSLKEIQLQEPIRYTTGDHVERWLHELLCLDATIAPLGSKGKAKAINSAPHPSQCDLYLVNRDALFSYHPASEAFLQKMMALYVASHYKNSPNDLQLMSDAPGQRLFVLLKPPSASSADAIPEPLAVLQVSLEGNISRQTVLNSLSRGVREAGDLIPWLLSNYFQDTDFASELSGARIVRVAVHPDYARMGYGTRAVELLRLFYEEKLMDADAVAAKDDRERQLTGEGELDTFISLAKQSQKESKKGLQEDRIALRDARRMPALLQRLPEQRPEQVDWLGVSYGLTQVLFKFWSKLGYTPLYVRQSPNDTTGEYTCIQLKALNEDEMDTAEGAPSWLAAFAADFRKRFISLLGYRFREFSVVLALSMLEEASNGAEADLGGNTHSNVLSLQEVDMLLSPFDMKRLEAYGNNMIDVHIVHDLFPILATLYFQRRLLSADENASGSANDGSEKAPLKLSTVQAAILLAVGLQRKDINDAEAELNLPSSQLLALFNKAVRRIVKSLRSVQRKEIEQDMPSASAGAPTRKGFLANGANKSGDGWQPLAKDLHEELKDAADMVETEAERERKQLQQELLSSVDLAKYRINNNQERDWSAAEKQVQALTAGGSAPGLNTTMSVKGPARDILAEDDKKAAQPKRKGERSASGKHNKKQKT